MKNKLDQDQVERWQLQGQLLLIQDIQDFLTKRSRHIRRELDKIKQQILVERESSVRPPLSIKDKNEK